MHSHELNGSVSVSPTSRIKLSARGKMVLPCSKPWIELSTRITRPDSWGVTSLQLKAAVPDGKLGLVWGTWMRNGNGVVYRVEAQYSREKRRLEFGSLGLNLVYNAKID